MAASVPLPSTGSRESPARVAAERSGHALPRGRATASAAQHRSPPPSARKRPVGEAEDAETPAAKRKFQTRQIDVDDRPSQIMNLAEQKSPSASEAPVAFEAQDPRHGFGLNEPEHVAGAQPILDDGAGIGLDDGINIAPASQNNESTGTKNMFAHLLFGGTTGLREDDVADTAAKVNTWRIIPARARPKIADMLIEIGSRATDYSQSASNQQRVEAWREFDYIFQILARCTEQDASTAVHRSGPKVDDIIKARVFTAEKYGWSGLVEEYHADAALRQKRDLDKGQPEHVPRTLGEPVSPQEADAFCRLAATMQCGAAAARITAAPVLPDSERLRQRLREKLHPVEDMPEKA